MPLTRYVKLRVALAPGMPGTISPPPRVSNPDMHHDTCMMHVPWCMSGSLTSGFLWSWWRGKRFRHSRRMRKPQFYVSVKRPIQFKKNCRSYRLTEWSWQYFTLFYVNHVQIVLTVMGKRMITHTTLLSQCLMIIPQCNFSHMLHFNSLAHGRWEWNIR